MFEVGLNVYSAGYWSMTVWHWHLHKFGEEGDDEFMIPIDCLHQSTERKRLIHRPIVFNPPLNTQTSARPILRSTSTVSLDPQDSSPSP